MKNQENIVIEKQTATNENAEKVITETINCPHCNAEIEVPKTKKSTTFWWGFLGFFLPIVAILMYFYKKGAKEDLRFNAMARGAFISLVILTVAVIIGAFATGVFFGLTILLY